jgi:hypothetical protein
MRVNRDRVAGFHPRVEDSYPLVLEYDRVMLGSCHDGIERTRPLPIIRARYREVRPSLRRLRLTGPEDSRGTADRVEPPPGGSTAAGAGVRECHPSVPDCGRKAPAPSFPGMEIANVFTVECDLGEEHDGFRIRETQIGPQLGADLIGGSVYEIDPGKKLWPYHLHHANEE